MLVWPCYEQREEYGIYKTCGLPVSSSIEPPETPWYRYKNNNSASTTHQDGERWECWNEKCSSYISYHDTHKHRIEYESYISEYFFSLDLLIRSPSSKREIPASLCSEIFYDPCPYMLRYPYDEESSTDISSKEDQGDRSDISYHNEWSDIAKQENR